MRGCRQETAGEAEGLLLAGISATVRAALSMGMLLALLSSRSPSAGGATWNVLAFYPAALCKAFAAHR